MTKQRSRRVLSALAAFATAFSTAGVVVAAAPAQAAETATVDQTAAVAPQLPDTVSADALPTVQINGVVWDQVIVGNTVYVGGEFTNARPAGAAPGVNTTPRTNLLAYDIRTGELISSFNPLIEGGKVVDLAASPDGTKLGVVGNFTKVNGVARYRTAVFNIPSGTLSNVSASLDAPAQSVAMSNSAMFVGGYFSRMSGTARSRVGAVSLTNGAALPFQVPVDNGQVMGLTVSPDGSQVVMSGNFTTVGGSDNPGYGLYRADAATGAGLPLPLNTVIRNAGTQSAILKLDSDATSFYGVGYHFGRGGSTEGTFQARWSDGNLVNIEDCHGDSYDVAAGAKDVIYVASHKHYCGNSGGFPQTEPWTYWHSTAWTKTTEGVNTPDIYGYPDNPGSPRPGLLPFYPRTDVGTFTGKSQATWSVKANDDYVVFGGEFPRVNGQPQQGLVRYAKKSIAPNKQGPRPTVSSVAWTANVQSFRRGQVKISYPTVWDYDDTKLTYKIWRGSSSTVIDTRTVDTTQWNVLTESFTDKNLAPGSSQRYYVQASDDDGNTIGTGWINVTVAAQDTITGYGAQVLDDGATKYWPLSEPAGSSVVTDYAGNDNTTAGTGVTRGVAGAMTNATEAASSFNGTADGRVVSQQLIQGPDTYSQELWFKTTTTNGGKLAGFGSAKTGDSGSYDRHIFMDRDGRIIYGVYPNAVRTLSSRPGLNDGEWHQVVATLGSTGMVLFIDGKRVAQRTDTTWGQNYVGYWKIGGDNLGGWADGNAFAGDIDDYSVFPTQLTARQVDNHWKASGRTSTMPAIPTDALGAAITTSDPDLYWRLDETPGSTTAADSATGGNTATYRGQVTQGVDGVAGGKAARLGTSPWGVITGNTAVNNPTSFSQEVWIKSTTTRGGRILGFGNSDADWFSWNYDRALWMLDNGRVRFGIWSGQTNTIDTQDALNDGAWHQVVSTFDSSGMKLYVDGKLQGTNPNTVAQDYSGFWKLGADNHWGDASDSGFSGDVDEVAVFPRALTGSEVQSHFKAGGTVANVPPSASFSTQVQDLKATFDATTSTDAEGGPLTYSWDFGDNTTGSGVTAEHTYAQTGNYTVTLTVKDADGGTDTESTVVSVQAPNVNPTASFTSSAQDLTVQLDGSASSDSDGQVVGRVWDFGDGSDPATGATTSHTYTAAGTYTVKLTVTDNRGGTDTATRQVTVTAPNVAPTAAFTATSSSLQVSVDGSGSADSDGSIASYSWSWGDGSANGSGKNANHTYATAGEKTITLTVTDDRGATASTTRTLTVTRVNAAPTAAFTVSSDNLQVAVDGSGSSDSDGSVASYAWSWGDGSADGSGKNANHTYATAGQKTITLTVTDNDGSTATATRQVTVSAANVSPTADFAATASGLGVSVDGSGSTDSDGSIASYAWSWGDGTADGSGATATHTYATGGQKTVTLTVTDNRGATATRSRTVTVTAPAATQLAQDGFDRSVTGGWGNAEIGGAWTLAGGRTRFSTGGSAGQMQAPAGQTLNADLASVSSTSSVITTEFSVDKLLEAGVEGQYVAIRGRKVGTNAYDARLRIASDGSVKMWLLRNGSTVVGTSYTAGFTVTPGAKYMLKMSVTGTSPTTVSAKVWPSTEQEPTAWQRTATDNTAGLQSAGSVGLFTWIPSASTLAPVVTQFHSFSVTAQ